MNGRPLLCIGLLLVLGSVSRHAIAQAGPPSASRPTTSVHLGGGNSSREVAPRTIVGTVKDAAGHRIPGAMVCLRNVNRSTLESVFADQQGEYRFGSRRLSDDFEVWAQVGDHKTAVKLVSSYIETPSVTVALEFTADAAKPSPSATKAPQASASTGTNQVPKPQ